MKSQDTYQEPKLLQFPGMIVRVYSPVLTEDERNRRMNNIHKQAANLLKKVKQ